MHERGATTICIGRESTIGWGREWLNTKIMNLFLLNYAQKVVVFKSKTVINVKIITGADLKFVPDWPIISIRS